MKTEKYLINVDILAKGSTDTSFNSVDLISSWRIQFGVAFAYIAYNGNKRLYLYQKQKRWHPLKGQKSKKAISVTLH